MKRISILVAFIACTLFLSAQDVTKFLGIPVDGFKPEMKRALIAKGFTYDSANDCFEGEFNGNDVYVFIVTNNNKVCRIMLVDKYERDESGIINRFNTLCSQFERNNKYQKLDEESFIIPETEDIGYNMLVDHKSYEAVYLQTPDITKFDNDMLLKMMKNMYGDDFEVSDPNDFDKVKDLLYRRNLLNNNVWFKISKGDYGKYRIAMYYDNEYNRANGEDL